MLPAKNRLTRDQDFQRVATKGRYSYSPLLTVKYYPNRLPVSRFGFVISTKIDKRAVVRNRVKRQVREVIRLRLANIRTGMDIVIIMKKASIGQEMVVLRNDLLSTLDKAGLYVD